MRNFLNFILCCSQIFSNLLNNLPELEFVLLASVPILVCINYFLIFVSAKSHLTDSRTEKADEKTHNHNEELFVKG